MVIDHYKWVVLKVEQYGGHHETMKKDMLESEREIKGELYLTIQLRNE